MSKEGKTRDNGFMFGLTRKPSGCMRFMADAVRFNHEVAGPKKLETRSIMIWGQPGIGKTYLVKKTLPDFMRKCHPEYKDKKFCVVTVAMAQLSEPGDLSGMPTLVEMEVDIEGERKTKQTMSITKLAPPTFAAELIRAGGQGMVPILLIDDYNRGGPHMLRASMQLIQDGNMVDWFLPEDTTIILTGNAEGGDHATTEMDQAMKTRLSHITMVPDLDEWVEWALDQEYLDERGILFLQSYRQYLAPKDLVEGQHEPRTTPRTWTKFLSQLKFLNAPHMGPGANYGIAVIRQEAYADLDPNVADAFVGALTDLGQKFPTPEEIMYDFDKKAKNKLHEFVDERREDLVSMCIGLVYMKIKDESYEPKKDPKIATVQENLMKLFSDEKISSENAYNMFFRLYNKHGDKGKEKLRMLIKDDGRLGKRVAKLL